MDSEQWRQAFAVFKASVGQAVDVREAFVAAACGGDATLRQAVDDLIRADGAAGGFLETPAAIRFLPGLDQPIDRHDLPKLAHEFAGTERFTVVRELGAGGMGIVYEARDRERDQIVALKTLLHASPDNVRYFKQEFRGLADVAHRNLVSLYELVVEPPHCFFTMELVDGVNLLDDLRRSGERVPQRIDRLCAVFSQLADGLSELHRHGKLHRDIKPSNVLVTPDGRVVILDFGLIADVAATSGGTTSEPAGTPAYISPEHVRGLGATAAGDWYGVGVTLYEALTGHVPFVGPFEEQLRYKTETDPLPPAQVAPDVPEDLSAICMDLISRQPERRFRGRDRLVELVRRHACRDPPTAAPGDASRDPPFVGREPALAALERAFIVAASGRPAAVYVHGPSGIGKSALVRRFLDARLKSSDALILRGRCYERESVPYGAVDGVIDSLSRHLGELSSAEAAALVPRDSLALARLFPVMRQVEAVSACPALDYESPDPLWVRGRAFAALRDLLAALAARQPLILYIDDFHWADADSLLLLDDVFRPSTAPPLLTVLCFRSEEVDSKPFLRALLERHGDAYREAIALEPMPDVEADELIASLARPTAPVPAVDRRRIAREAGGNPFLLEQMTRYVAVNRADADRPATLADVVGARLSVLPGGARSFLDTLAICGRPTAAQVVYEASGLAGDERPLVASLRSAHFLRSSGSADRVELNHDRIRQTLTAALSAADARRIHGAMVATLVSRRIDDPEALFEHYRGAGAVMDAALQAASAARQANQALAFDRAGFFYRQAIALAPASALALDWKTGLAAALANAGRPADAAEIYLDAAVGADPVRRIELQRRAAEQLLIGGHIDRGLAVIRTVLAAVRLRLAAGPRSALASLVVKRLQLRRRGLAFDERTENRVAAGELLRIDTCWSVVTGLMLVDSIRAADFQTRHLRLALDAGEPFRIIRALAVEAIFRASRNRPGGRGSSRHADRARAMADTLGRPHAIALATLSAGMCRLLVGEWRQATTLCGQALTMLRDQCIGATWEMNLAQNLFVGSLLFRGELRDVAGRLPALLAAAQERGNLYFETELRTRMNLVWLAADDPDEGERQADGAMARWSDEGFHRQHYNHVLARIQTELYRGRADAAWQIIDGNWAAMRRASLFRVQFLTIEASYLRARCALSMAASGRDRRRFLRIARHDARRIARQRMAWSNPLSFLVGAAADWQDGRPERAAQALQQAADGFDGADMPLYASAARRRLGAIVEGDGGRELVRQANVWSADQDVKNPAQMTRMLAPGFDD